MPYRRLHLVLPLVFPAILVAFWPGYFGQFATAPAAMHLHGMVATFWLALVLAQGWSIHTRRAHLHRTLGLALFVLVPLFAAGGLLLTQAMAGLGLARADPFHAQFGVRLALLDLVSVATIVTLVALAVARRREPHRHAAAMAATLFPMLPPILGRLLPIIPVVRAVPGVHPFAVSFHIAQVVAVAGALLLARGAKAGAPVLRGVAVMIALQSVAFETVARTARWEATTAALQGVPALWLGSAGALAAAAVLAYAWTRVPARRPRVAAA
jgi:hypothetical protein